LLEKLDEIWFSMTATQISFINSLSEKLVNNKITLEQLENKRTFEKSKDHHK
jgi:hypothetical protein